MFGSQVTPEPTTRQTKRQGIDQLLQSGPTASGPQPACSRSRCSRKYPNPIRQDQCNVGFEWPSSRLFSSFQVTLISPNYIQDNVSLTSTRTNLQTRSGDLLFQHYAWLYRHGHHTNLDSFSRPLVILIPVLALDRLSSQHKYRKVGWMS